MANTMKYGPQTAEIEALLGRVRTLTRTEATALKAAQDAAWYAARGTVRSAAWGAAWGAVREAAWVAALDAAWDAVWGAARAALWYAGRGAVWDAVLALSVRDLITPDGFTQKQYDLLTGPWRRVVGRVHPEDAPLTGMESPA